MSYASILQGTKMGKGNKVHQNAVLGAEPQDFHYTGEESSLIIGDNNDIRENVVISRATFWRQRYQNRKRKLPDGQSTSLP